MAWAWSGRWLLAVAGVAIGIAILAATTIRQGRRRYRTDGDVSALDDQSHALMREERFAEAEPVLVELITRYESDPGPYARAVVAKRS